MAVTATTGTGNLTIGNATIKVRAGAPLLHHVGSSIRLPLSQAMYSSTDLYVLLQYPDKTKTNVAGTQPDR